MGRALDLAQAVRRVANSPWGPQKEQEAFIYNVLLHLYTDTDVASMVQQLPDNCSVVLAQTSALAKGQITAILFL